MIGNIFLQAEAGASILVAIIVAVIVSAIFYGILKRNISSLKEKLSPLANIDPKIQYDVSQMQTNLQNVYTDLTNLKTTLPHTNEVTAVQENIKQLCTDFTSLKTNIDEQVNKMLLVTAEDLNNAKDQMIKTATEKITEHANSHLRECTQLDLGHFLSDYGWMNNNTARLGIDITAGNVKVQTRSGVNASATRVYPVALVR